MKVLNGLLSLVLVLTALLAYAENPASQEEAIEKNRVSILSFDEHGTLLRSGIGFLYDGNTLICGYSNVKGASSIKAEEEGSHSYSTRLISYSDSYDFAVLKTEEEDMDASSLAGSDTLAVGDKVYFFQRDQGKWKLMQATVKGWIDSGEGYETIRLQGSAQASSAPKARSQSYEPSPLYNASAKVIGWTYRDSVGIPLKAIASYLETRNSSVPLTQIGGSSDLWSAQKLQEKSPEAPFECCNMILVEGTAKFPFHVQFPQQWEYQSYPQASKYLLRAKDPDFGVVLELRVMPQNSDDLSVAVERIETLIFSGMSRSELAPFSTDHLSGFKATYDDSDPEKGYSRAIFYSMSKKLFYALSITYPKKHAEELEPVIETIFASFEI